MRAAILRSVIITAVFSAAIASASEAQLATVGAGVLLSKRSPQPVAELHAESPPFYRTRAYITLSWTDDSSKPTVISAAERSVLHVRRATTGIGAGLLWLEVNDYKPYPIIVSSTVVPLPIKRTSFVGIASTQPFQDFEWSLVLKIGVLVWFVR